jgi:hypothetical protein
MITGEIKNATGADLAKPIADLDPTTEDERQARTLLLKLLAANPNGGQNIRTWASDLILFARTEKDREKTRAAILRLLVDCRSSWAATKLVDSVVKLGATSGDKRRAREVLLVMLVDPKHRPQGALIVQTMARLDPTVSDLIDYQAWTSRPSAELLAAVRRNSVTADWLAALPSLPSLPDPYFSIPLDYTSYPFE